MVKGLVYKVFSRQAGRGTAYSIKLDGDETYYGCGFKNPGNLDGKYVSFEAGKNAKGYWDANLATLTVLDSAPQVANKSVASATAGGKDDYWRRKEERDLVNDVQRHIGASANTAIAFVDLLLKTDSVAVPTKKADRADIIFDLVAHYATKFQSLSEGAKPADPKPADESPAAEPAEDNWS